jgi:hypothetical protein
VITFASCTAVAPTAFERSGDAAAPTRPEMPAAPGGSSDSGAVEAVEARPINGSVSGGSLPATTDDDLPSEGTPLETPLLVGEEGAGCLAAGSGDYASAGPYRVATLLVDLGTGIAANQATGEFTIYYPQPLEQSCPHPIVAWGNGTGVTGPNVYEFFNHNAASWGIVVIAAHDSNTGSGEYHRRGIDYLLAQDADPSSRFFGRLSARAGVSGHSQGGLGAAAAATHPNVRALVPVGASGRALETTAFLCLTGTKDIAPDACRSAVAAAPGPAMAAIWEGGDHVSTETLLGFSRRDPGTIQMMRLYAAWFRCFLGADAAACQLFRGGSSCGVCDDPGWAEVITKNL